jgi:hypothetical protein
MALRIRKWLRKSAINALVTPKRVQILDASRLILYLIGNGNTAYLGMVVALSFLGGKQKYPFRVNQAIGYAGGIDFL